MEQTGCLWVTSPYRKAWVIPLDNPKQMHKFRTVNDNCTNKKVAICQGI